MSRLKAFCSVLRLMQPNQHHLQMGEPRTVYQYLNTTSFKDTVRTKLMHSLGFWFLFNSTNLQNLSDLFIKIVYLIAKKKKIYFWLPYAVYPPDTTFPVPTPSLFSHTIQQCPLKDWFHNVKISLYHQLLFRTFLLPLSQLDLAWFLRTQFHL